MPVTNQGIISGWCNYAAEITYSLSRISRNLRSRPYHAMQTLFPVCDDIITRT